ncbi:putative reverse transcriptase domain-containing protein, partial [Tanacetum coccineum]
EKEHEEHLKAILELLKKEQLYAKFIEGFLNIAKSMTKLTQKGIKFDKGKKEENAFQLIKQKLCSAPIMALPKGSEDFVVYCDASHKGLGAVLMQREKVVTWFWTPLVNCDRFKICPLLANKGRMIRLDKLARKLYGTYLSYETAYSSRIMCPEREDYSILSMTMLVLAMIDFGKGWLNIFPIGRGFYIYRIDKRATLIKSKIRWSSKLRIGLCSRSHLGKGLYNLKCYADEPLIMPLEGIHVDDKLQFMEEPVEIMEREIKRLKRSRIPLVKVRWNSRRGPEFTWEREDSFKQKYPQLFTNRATSSTTRS